MRRSDLDILDPCTMVSIEQCRANQQLPRNTMLRFAHLLVYTINCTSLTYQMLLF